MVNGRRWVLKNHFNGAPTINDFELVEEELPELKDGEFMYRSEYISVDPYVRPYADLVPVPSTVMGSSVSVIEKSKNKDFPEGSKVVVHGGWVERGVMNPDQTLLRPWIYPKIEGVSPSTMLGSCGLPGNTAYFGLLRICEPKLGDVVVVSGAAGAVGSMVGQIAKIKGCKVIGLAGTDEKVEWLKEIGFDVAHNYKEVDVGAAIKESAPAGVDCYFDNVGGAMSISVIQNMKHRGRVAVCGSISNYNEMEGEASQHRDILPLTISKEIRIEGFAVLRWASEFAEGLEELAGWITRGDIKVRETVEQGFENTPKAFIGLFQGANIGKMVVKV